MSAADDGQCAHVVVARHLEDVAWLHELLAARPTWRAFVYNDGPPLGEPPAGVASRFHEVAGDGVPSECTKYVAHILEHYADAPPPGTRVIFLQADPFYHNPTLGAILRESRLDEWDAPFQNLGLWGHPPPWGCSDAIALRTAPHLQAPGGQGLTWKDRMGDDFHGEFFRDPFWDAYCRIHGYRPSVAAFSRALGFQPPAAMFKTYSALFSTTWAKLAAYPREFWERVHGFLARGAPACDTPAAMTPRDRGMIMEYAWAVVMQGTPLG